MTKKVFEEQLIKIRDLIREMYGCPMINGFSDCDNCACGLSIKTQYGKEPLVRCVHVDLLEVMERYDLMDDLPENL